MQARSPACMLIPHLQDGPRCGADTCIHDARAEGKGRHLMPGTAQPCAPINTIAKFWTTAFRNNTRLICMADLSDADAIPLSASMRSTYCRNQLVVMSPCSERMRPPQPALSRQDSIKRASD